MALRDLGADFEHYKVVEFDKYAIASYNAIHGTSFPTTDIRDIKGADLGIVEVESFVYLLTYSFPCQDLSLAGKRRGMTKGSGTRSGLLWEVERLLNEVDNLPQVLLMENVPQVLSDDNISDFHSWCDFLGSKGYKCYSQILNAKDYGVAQNRERCFMVSILGDYNYKFPQPIPLETTMKDYLEPEVDECYYINTEKAQKLIQDLVESGQLEDKNVSNTVRGGQRLSRPSSVGCGNREQQPISAGNCIKPKPIENGMCLTARYYKGLSNYNPENAVFEKTEGNQSDGKNETGVLSDT
jgi:DNA-cytosine methyltransferase